MCEGIKIAIMVKQKKVLNIFLVTFLLNKFFVKRIVRIWSHKSTLHFDYKFFFDENSEKSFLHRLECCNLECNRCMLVKYSSNHPPETCQRFRTCRCLRKTRNSHAPQNVNVQKSFVMSKKDFGLTLII